MLTTSNSLETHPMIRPSSLRGAPGLLVTLLLPALAACGAASRDAVLSCAVPADCGPGAHCLDGACQVSAPPTADFTPPAGLTTNRAVSMTSTSRDPDPGGAVTGWSWAITRGSAACDADVDVGDGATLQAVFWCPGTYEISLVVRDDTGLESDPVLRTVMVAALPGAPTVTAGPPSAVDHRCSGAPLRCELVQPVALAASAQAPLGGPLDWQWTAVPPNPSRAGATARFSPSPAVSAAWLALETDGGAISGAWQLRVRVTDGAGNLGQAIQLVTVGDHPPTIDAAAVALDHSYAAGTYRTAGAFSVPVSDPDGDPLQVSLTLLEPAGSGCSGGLGALTGGSGHLTLTCPGPAGLQASGRALEVSVTDSNGATASSQVPVQVRNRLPVIRRAARVASGDLSLNHTVGPCPTGTGQCFLVSDDSPFEVDDPDGDPVSGLTLVPGVEASRTSSFGEVTSGPSGPRFLFGTPVNLPGEFRAIDGTSGFWLTATASDPFGASVPAEPLAVRILNRAPVLKAAVGAVTAGHHYNASTSGYLAGTALAAFEDPDGDPLVDAGSQGDEECATFTFSGGVASVTCLRAFQVASASYPTLSGFAGGHALVVKGGDGWQSASAAAALTIANAPPVLPDFNGAVEACSCECPQWEADLPGVCAFDYTWAVDPRSVTFEVCPTDADGDPLALAFSSASGAVPAPRTAAPGTCVSLTFLARFPVSVQVTANDGVSQAATTWTASRAICSKAGEVCTPPKALRR